MGSKKSPRSKGRGQEQDRIMEDDEKVVSMHRASVNRPSVHRRIWNHRMKIFGLFALVLGAVILVVFILNQQIQNYVYTSYEVMQTVDRIQVEGSQVLPYNGNFLTYSKDGIRCTDISGHDLWSSPYEMQNPMVEVQGDYVAVADLGGRDIHIFDHTGLKGTIHTSYPAQQIKVTANGLVLAILDNGNATPFELYDYNGEIKYGSHITMAQSGYPLTVGISEDGKLIGISYLYLDKGVLSSRVAFYNLGEVGKNYSDHLVSGYSYAEEVIPVLGFMNNSQAFAVGAGRIIFFEGKERPTNTGNSLIHEKIRSVYYGNGYIGLVFNNTNGEDKYRLDIYQADGKMRASIPFNLEYSEIFFEENQVVIYNASSANIYNMEGLEKFAGDFKEPVNLMLPTNRRGKYTLVTDNAIQTILLR